jgi:SAM-dependent methyltransferase
MAERGHTVFAMDTNVGESTGLRAGATYSDRVDFERVQGSMRNPPLREGAFDAVVCSSSLHHLGKPQAPVARLAELLRPGGLLVVMNSPVHRDFESARRAERDRRAYLRSRFGGEWIDKYVHFTIQELQSAMEDAGLSDFSLIIPDFDLLFRLERRLKSLLLRMEVASFPVVTAKKPVV